MPRRSPGPSARARPEGPARTAPASRSTRLVTSAQMRELDRRTIELGTPGSVLMERAGRGVAERVRRDFGAACRRGVLVVAGRGNNGGDGFVIARLLKERGLRVTVVLLAERERVVGDARLNLDRWRRARGRTSGIEGGGPGPALERELARTGVVVDAILGTGLSSDVSGPIAVAIETIAVASSARATVASPLVVIAVDIPSGLDGDRGEPRGTALP